MMDPGVINAGAVQIPYSRTSDFSELFLRAEASLIALLNAPPDARVVFITGSGTASMEAALLNFIHHGQSVAIIDGGTFGNRFVEICRRHGIDHQPIEVDRDPLTDGTAFRQIRRRVDALLVTAHETSIGHLYDLAATARFAAANDALHIVDAISLFGTDRINMSESNIDVLILSSNKGLALAPGMSMLVMSPRALSRLVAMPRSYYLDVRAMLSDGLRGQTPFTPATGIFLQLDARLSVLTRESLDRGCRHAHAMASHFRAHMAALPLRPYSRHMPNAMTALEVFGSNQSARTIAKTLAREYGLVVGANGGKLADSVFRVSHMGALELNDVDLLISALTHIFATAHSGVAT
jgi:aspartate aminotransferase-like enzyme